MKVKPKSGLKVRDWTDPYRKVYLPPEGKEVPENQHWLRALASGDVVLCEEKKEEKPLLSLSGGNGGEKKQSVKGKSE